MVTAAVALLACDQLTGIRPRPRDPNCIYKGDTLGVLWRSSNGVVTECDWLLADVTSCGTTPVNLAHPACLVGAAAEVRP